MPVIVMPRLVEHMTDALVARWLVEDGASVATGDELVEIETDKATTAIQSDFDGTIRILAEEGAIVAVEGPLAEVSAGGATGQSQAESEPESASAGESEQADSGAESIRAAVDSVRPPGRILVSPLARRMAERNGIDLALLLNGDAERKLRKADVETAIAQKLDAPDPAPVRVSADSENLHDLTRTQQLIARKMAESRSTIPDFTVTISIEMTACKELRSNFRVFAKQGQVVPTYNDIIVKAVGVALREFPKINSSYRGGAIQFHDEVNVGVAVAADGVLVVPTVRDVDTSSLSAIARTTRSLTAAVRDGSITAPQLSGATFTVSNLGMLGVEHFTAVVNPPQAAILAVGAIEDRAVVRDGELAARAMTTVSLCSDHRVIYGADAGEFVRHLKDLLENPLAVAL